MKNTVLVAQRNDVTAKLGTKISQNWFLKRCHKFTEDRDLISGTLKVVQDSNENGFRFRGTFKGLLMAKL